MQNCLDLMNDPSNIYNLFISYFPFVKCSSFKFNFIFDCFNTKRIKKNIVPRKKNR